MSHDSALKPFGGEDPSLCDPEWALSGPADPLLLQTVSSPPCLNHSCTNNPLILHGTHVETHNKLWERKQKSLCYLKKNKKTSGHVGSSDV